MVFGFQVLFRARACVSVFVFVPPVRETQGKQVDPQKGCQALRDDGSIPDEEHDDGLPNGSTVAPDLVLGTNESKKHPQYKQHYQEDRSQEDKRDIEKGLITRMER
jgi:hypothetical protein